MPRRSSLVPRAWLVPSLLAGLGVIGWACQDTTPGEGSGDDGSGTSDVLRRDVLASIAHNVMVPETAAFAESASSLQAAARAWADAPDEETRAELQSAWRDTSTQWQRLEVLQIGPAAPSLLGIGGEDLRDAIYSWPTADTCSVDRALVDEDYAASDFFATELVWAYGLDALEHLAFSDGAAHTCPTQVQLDAPWDALSEDERTRRRGAYAVVIADGVAAQATALADRWSTDSGDFATALAEPGEGDSPYTSEAEALDEVFRAMFYVDLQTKDGKLGIPMGVVAGCAEPPCVDLLEAPHSGDAVANIITNLEALQLVLDGGPEPETADGFDDLLEAVDQGEIADTLRSQISQAIAVAQSYDQSLQSVVTGGGDPQPLYDALKAVTDTLKGPFVMALMLTIPAEGAGDAD